MEPNCTDRATDWNLGDRESVNMVGCWESHCGAGVCRGLRSRSWLRGSCRVCHNNGSFACVCVRVSRMSTSAFSEAITRQVPLALVTKTWRQLVRLPRRIRERGGGRQAALSNRDVQRGTDREPCLLNDAGNMFAWICNTLHVRRWSHSPGWRAG